MKAIFAPDVVPHAYFRLMPMDLETFQLGAIDCLRGGAPNNRQDKNESDATKHDAQAQRRRAADSRIVNPPSFRRALKRSG